MLTVNACVGSPEDSTNLSFNQFQIPVGSAPAAVLALDFNRDEHDDLVVANRADGTITVLQGNGKGQFQLHSTVPAGEAVEDPRDLAAGDFDEDGWIDLIFPNHGTKYVTILYGGKNGFEQRSDSRIEIDVLPHPHSIKTSDMNGDGYMDFIIDDHRREALKLYFGGGNGRFRRSVSIPTGIQPPYLKIALKDLDNDGNLDIVIPNKKFSMFVMGDGAGNFSSPAKLEANGLRSYSIAVTDINGDGLTDVGGGKGVDGAFAVWFGSEDRYRMEPGSPYPLAPNVRNGFIRPLGTDTGTADVNGDGFEDFLVSSSRGKTLMLILGGTGQLRPVHLEVEGNPSCVATGDFNNDGRIDLVTANNNAGADEVSVFLQREN